MKYLTQIMIPKLVVTRIRDPYGWHKTIWKAFSGRPEKERDFLFRIDDRGDDFRVYILSEEKPAPLEFGVWETKAVQDGFLDRERYRFQLKANPTMRRKEDGRRLGLFKDDLLRAWMIRKAMAGGFEVDERTLVVGAPMEERFRKGEVFGKHIAVDFQGVLEVRDKVLFKKSFAEGIGSAKSFGYGLLMIQAV
jgi:CRISPR system Cascade subunit CasE